MLLYTRVASFFVLVIALVAQAADIRISRELNINALGFLVFTGLAGLAKDAWQKAVDNLSDEEKNDPKDFRPTVMSALILRDSTGPGYTAYFGSSPKIRDSQVANGVAATQVLGMVGTSWPLDEETGEIWYEPARINSLLAQCLTEQRKMKGEANKRDHEKKCGEPFVIQKYIHLTYDEIPEPSRNYFNSRDALIVAWNGKEGRVYPPCSGNGRNLGCSHAVKYLGMNWVRSDVEPVDYPLPDSSDEQAPFECIGPGT